MAEINQIKQLIEGLEKLAFEEKFAFVVLDEIFTGTNPTDGEAAALEFLKHVVQKKLNRSFFMIISTHYRLLSEVTKEYPFCLNYKIDVIREKDGNIKKMFTWSPGISSMRVALDLFKENFC